MDTWNLLGLGLHKWRPRYVQLALPGSRAPAQHHKKGLMPGWKSQKVEIDEAGLALDTQQLLCFGAGQGVGRLVIDVYNAAV